MQLYNNNDTWKRPSAGKIHLDYSKGMPCVHMQRDKMSYCPGKSSYLSILYLVGFVDLAVLIWICFDSVNLVNETNNLTVLEELRVLGTTIAVLSFTCTALFFCSILYWGCFQKMSDNNGICYYVLELVFLSSSYILTYIILGLSIGTSAMVTLYKTTVPCQPNVLPNNNVGLLQSIKISALEDLSMRLVALAIVTTILKTLSLVMGHLIPKLYKKTYLAEEQQNFLQQHS